MIAISLTVRERPPLYLSATIDGPSGKRARWSEDEHDPANAFGGLTKSSVVPGGWEQFTCTLPRKQGIEYGDLEELSTISLFGAGGAGCGEYRLETAPRVSGDQSAVSPGGVGWQAALSDDNSVQMIYADADQTRWGDPPPNEQTRNSGSVDLNGSLTFANQNGTIVCAIANQAFPAAAQEAQTWYQAPAGVKLAEMIYVVSKSNPPTGWTFEARAMDSDTLAGSDVIALTFGGVLTTKVLTTARRYLALRVASAGTALTPAAGASEIVNALTVYGNHGLTTHAIDSSTPDGLLASDVMAHAVGKWCPILNVTAESITPTLFVIPHLIFPDATNVADIVTQANRFELNDWAVWDDKTFWLYPPGSVGRSWRARIAPAQLQETGPQVDRVWNSILVQYTDDGGVQRTVGPVGSGADTEDASLTDPDPLNPANELGIKRRKVVQAGTLATASAAIKIGSSLLQTLKELDTSGQAQLVGYVDDDHGVTRPASQVRAGDTISFVDAADTSSRRIVKESYAHDSRTCTISLDSPPDGLQEALDRAGVREVG